MRAWFARAWARIRRLSSAQVSATVGFTALLFTLAYNGYSIRAQTEQSRQQVAQTQRQTREAEETRIAGEVSLLSQLNQTFNALDQELGETKAEDWICDPNHGKRSLPRSDELVLYRALDYYDWLAWLFNHGRVKFPAAREYWQEKMLEAKRFGDYFFPEPVIAADFPELERMRKAIGAPLSECETTPP